MDDNTISRFWKKVDKNGPTQPHMPHLGQCWTWLGAKWRPGYGGFTVDGKSMKAHRFSFMIHNTCEMPVVVMHECDNPICVNPGHLRAGTHAENAADRNLKNRQAAGDRNGSRTKPERLRRGNNHPFRINPNGHVIGELCGKAILTSATVLLIRERIGTVKQSEIAAEFGVSQQTISAIKCGEIWRHAT
jgi:hypothetical protein